MAKVIIYEQNGQVAVCNPTGELPIEQVLAKDCPAGAIIVDESELPTENFDAWKLIDGKVVVNEERKQALVAAQQSAMQAKQSAMDKLTKLGLTPNEILALGVKL